MKKVKNIVCSLIITLALLTTTCVKAGNPGDTGHMAICIRAGYSLGATTPLGIPASIRELNSYSLSPNVMLGVDIRHSITDQWGVQTGLHFEHKGMDATVTTKGYHMAMVKGGEELEGVYTGRVEQHVKAWMFTLPLQATYNISQRWQLRLGPYLSVVTARAFDGNVSDGYLRKDTPTGQKIEMGHEADERATYDFTPDVRRLQMGLDLGADWQLARKVGLSADLSWGLTGLMHSSFKTIEQALFPIYGTLSVVYQLN